MGSKMVRSGVPLRKAMAMGCKEGKASPMRDKPVSPPKPATNGKAR